MKAVCRRYIVTGSRFANEFYTWYESNGISSGNQAAKEVEANQARGYYRQAFMDFLSTLDPSNVYGIVEGDSRISVYYKKCS